VLRLVAAGLSTTEIARLLFLSVGTVKRHLPIQMTGVVTAVDLSAGTVTLRDDTG
jgi:DNA-binding CsgD family transcriptional regulator